MRTHVIFSPTTSCGKTLLTTLLCRHHPRSSYIKPIQCGEPMDETVVGAWVRERGERGEGRTVTGGWRGVTCNFLPPPTSPHIACVRTSTPLSNDHVRRSILAAIEDEKNLDQADRVCYVETAGGVCSPGGASPDNFEEPGAVFTVGPSGGGEGGVGRYFNLLSSGSSGGDGDGDGDGDSEAQNEKNKNPPSSIWSYTPQSTFLYPLGLPCILLGDGTLGGISQTITAYESLKSRGWVVDAVGIIRGEGSGNGGYGDNSVVLGEYLVSEGYRNRIQNGKKEKDGGGDINIDMDIDMDTDMDMDVPYIFSLPPHPPEPPSSGVKSDTPGIDMNLIKWFEEPEVTDVVAGVWEDVEGRYRRRRGI